MKSIVEEAPSLEKAISNAWNRAGKPKKFTVTIFQEAEKNFFGMSKAPAKIGFIFDHEPRGYTKQPAHQAPQRNRPEKIKAAPRVTHEKKAEQNAQEQKNSRFWPQEMINSVHDWITDTLKIMGKETITFSIKPNRYHLKITFSQPLSQDQKEEKALYRSFAHLAMQAQRLRFKKVFKHHKIILTST